MHAPKVTLVDYGVGNLLNVARALEHVGAKVMMVESGTALAGAERVVLPGVGAFPDGMRELSARGFVKPLQEFAATGRPLLGICLGMQMLLDSSNEFEHTQGLGLVPGRVEAIPALGVSGKPHKIPHIGWNKLQPATGADWRGTLLDDVPQKNAMYFVHSFMAVPLDLSHRLADYDYDGVLVSAAIRKGNLYGCQFHPEKSAEFGLGILRRFIRT